MTIPNLAFLSPTDPITISTANSVAGLSFNRSDLSNTVSLTQSSTGLLTCSGQFTATQFNGSGAGLTSIPISAISTTGTASSSTYLRGDGSWSTVSGGSGTVTDFSIVNANGFTGSVSNSTSTPALTLSTTISGLLKGSSGALIQAVAGTDYLSPSGAISDIYTIQSLGSVSTAQSPTAANGRYVKLTLTGNIVINLPAGLSSSSTEKMIFEITQGGSGSYTIGWAGGVKFVNGMTPVLSTYLGAVDLVEFVWNGSYWYLNNISNNIIGLMNAPLGYRPSAYTTTSGNMYYSNAGNAYDKTTQASVDSSSAGYIYISGQRTSATCTFQGFTGSSLLVGSLHINWDFTTDFNASYQIDYSLDSGTTWITNIVNISGNKSITDTVITNVTAIPSNIKLRCTLSTGTNCYSAGSNIYDIVFIAG